MGAGGAPHYQLSRIGEKYPLSLHGIGLSIGGPTPLNTDHLDRFKALIDRYEPGLVSEHLAWSSHDTAFLNDLLPLPYTPETLALVIAHVDQTQSHLGRCILLENPATYVVFEESSYDEIDFLSEIVKHTGCGLLLDVNNVYVSCTNHRPAVPRQFYKMFHKPAHAPCTHTRQAKLAQTCSAGSDGAITCQS